MSMPVPAPITRDWRIGSPPMLPGWADPLGHAEIYAVREAAAAIGDWRLEGTTMVVTLEPCAMCAGAMVLARVGRVVYGSTTWVYSDCAEQAVDEGTPIPAPRHLYTATKLAGETYCAGYAELFELQAAGYR